MLSHFFTCGCTVIRNNLDIGMDARGRSLVHSLVCSHGLPLHSHQSIARLLRTARLAPALHCALVRLFAHSLAALIASKRTSASAGANMEEIPRRI